MSMSVRIHADTDRCIGAGQCVLTAPDIFDSGEDGLVVVLVPEPAEALLDDVREAVDLCPARAIGLSGEPPVSRLSEPPHGGDKHE